MLVEHCCVPGVHVPPVLEELELEDELLDELELEELDEPPADELLALDPESWPPRLELLAAEPLLLEPVPLLLEPESPVAWALDVFDPELPAPLSGRTPLSGRRRSVLALSPSTASQPTSPTAAMKAHPCLRLTVLSGCYVASRPGGTPEDGSRRRPHGVVQPGAAVPFQRDGSAALTIHRASRRACNRRLRDETWARTRAACDRPIRACARVAASARDLARSAPAAGFAAAASNLLSTSPNSSAFCTVRWFVRDGCLRRAGAFCRASRACRAARSRNLFRRLRARAMWERRRPAGKSARFFARDAVTRSSSRCVHN